MIYNLSNQITADYRQFKNIVTSTEFPWLYSKTTNINPNEEDCELFCHPLLQRPGKGSRFSKQCSNYTELAVHVAEQVLDYNRIQFETFFRMAVNFTYNTKVGSPKHEDHPFPHKNLLIYLSSFTDGSTVVCDSEKIYKSEPKEDLPIVFSGLHYNEPPSSGNRIVLIATFI
jgi:hypothetical protein